MFSTCSELTPRAPIPDGRMERIMQPWTYEKPLERQVAEAVAIQRCQADQLLNSKSEWEQPAVERLIVTRELPEQEERRRGGGVRGRGRPQGGAHP